MNALQKVALLEVAVPIVALVVVVAIYPWLGGAAAGGFAVLGLLGLTPLLLRPRNHEVVIDERDRGIDHKARLWGFGTGWMFLVVSLIAISMWHAYHDRMIPPMLTNAIIWLQFVVCYVVKGATGLWLYRDGNRAT